jgi:VIT1/CCC1 family predicted Fe2+/Mn2+ transporter
VAVDVHGHVHGRVADDLQDDPGTDPEREQRRHAGVANVVEPHATEPTFAVDPLQAAFNVQGPGVELDVGPVQPARFGPSKPEHDQRHPEGVEPVTPHSREEPPRLVGSERVDAGGFWEPGDVAEVERHPETPQQPRAPGTLRRWRRRLADERAEGQVYRDLAERRSGEERDILLGLAHAEERHAAHWANLLGDDAGPVRAGHPRMRLLAWLARRFGSVFVLALAQRAESRTPYDVDADATAAMAADERIHQEVVRGLAARGRARVSGTFRAAVFGANDGLVSNLSLVLGVTGGGVSAQTVLLTGVAGLLAGALSMGAGEYVSVRSQRELLAASHPDPVATRYVPWLDVDANELALVYRARGMSADEADQHAADQLRDRDPSPDRFAAGAEQDHNVVGTGIGAGLSSFAFFASGAAVPILPFLFGLTGLPAVTVALLLVGVALLVSGAIVGVLSGGPPLRRGLRQLAIGAGAAGVTYALGLLVGSAVG